MKITIDVDERRARTRWRKSGTSKPSKKGTTQNKRGWLPREEWLKQQREKRGGTSNES